MKIVLAFNSESIKALEYTIQLCQNLKEYSLNIVNIVALNPDVAAPFLDHLNKAQNMEIEDMSKGELTKCMEILKTIQVEYNFAQIHGSKGEVGQILKSYLKDNPSDLVILGHHSKGTFERWFLDSVSEYCINNLDMPVTIVKELQ